MQAAAQPLLLVGRLLGLSPLVWTTAKSPEDGQSASVALKPSTAWRAYSWTLTVALTASMTVALYGEVPGKARNRVAQRFRADVFVFTVTVVNDAVSVFLLILANVKTRPSTDALNMLAMCESLAGALSGRSVWRRRVQLQVWLVLFGIAVYLAAVALLFVQGESEAEDAHAALWDQSSSMWGLAHLPSLPLQLFFCLLFGNQVCLIWLQVRALNRRLQVICTEDTGAPVSRSYVTWRVSAEPRKRDGPAIAWASSHNTASLPGAPRNVHVLRTLYSEVRHALSLLSSAHGLELLLMVLSTFLATTTSLYIRLTNRDDGSNLALGWSIFVACMLFAVLYAGELVKRESRRTTELTQRFLIHQELPQALRQEVRGLSQQLLHQGLSVSAYGFLQLDYSMLQGLVGSVTTYLIMVIQLSPEENEDSGGARQQRQTS